MYLARLEILGLDTNENFASSPTFVASELIDRGHHIPSLDNFFAHVHTSRADSRIPPWLPNAISPTSPTISNMVLGFPSSIHPYVNCSTSYSTNPPPPPGLGPPAVTLASLANHVSNGYPFNHSMPASSIYVNGASTGNNIFSSVRARAVFCKSCNLIGSGSGQYFHPTRSSGKYPLRVELSMKALLNQTLPLRFRSALLLRK